MKILLLCDRVPDAPSDGLLLRLLALARELAPRHRIDLLCWRSRRAAGEPEAGLFTRVWAVPAPPPPPRGRFGPLSGWSPQSLYSASPETAALLEHEIDPADYDVVLDSGGVLFAQLPPRWRDVPLVVDYVDDMVLTFRRAQHAAPNLRERLRAWKCAYVFGRFEAETMRRAAHCVMVGDEDAASFARVSPQVPVSVIANGVDTAYFAPDGSAARPGHLVFEGTMSFPPNEQAALHLVRDIMPRVWQRRPEATLALVGRDPAPVLRALAADPRVAVTGSVPDVRRHVREAEVFVCPLVSGAGIKNKLLQAWAMERPVVATSMSIGGLAARDGEELLVRDGAAAFADGVLTLLDDAALRARLGAAGRRAALERFAWSAMAGKLEALLASARRRAA
jgi:polysaccharide biosynthesis protein PslH